MKINNKITPFLTGPYLFFGFIFVVSTLMGLYNRNWYFALISLIIAIYLFTTFSGVEIDTERKKFRAYNKHFGLFKTGRWRTLKDYLGVTLVPMKSVTTMYSRSNRVKNRANKNFGFIW